MTSRTKKIWYIAIPIVVIGLLILLNFLAKNKVRQELDQVLAPSEYENLYVNIFTNTFKLDKVDTKQQNIGIKADAVVLNGISYFKLLFNDEMVIDKIRLKNPEVMVISEADSTSKKKKNQQKVLIKRLEIEQAKFSSRKNDSLENDIFISVPQAEFRDLSNDSKNNLFQPYKAEIDSLYLEMNAEHYITAAQLNLSEGKMSINDLQIVPKYSKPDFDRRIPYEKDRVELKIAKITTTHLQFERLNDSLLIKEPKMAISGMNLSLYRNKLVTDDNSHKPLYNQVLRELPFKLNIEEIDISEGKITYEEKVKEGQETMKIQFNEISGHLANIHNLAKLEPQPKISASAKFMNVTPIEIDWTFPVFDPANSFTISGSFGTVNGETLDPFLVPSLDAQVRGRINSIHFNFSGNENILRGDFVMKYDDLKVEILKDDGNEKSGFLSAIANIFVQNKGEQKPENEGLIVERNKARSFWNFMWMGLRKGLIDTVKAL